jgi:CO/xanthine dehydrogenase Mo-binding subunit
MRGFGAAQVPIGSESQMDILSEMLGMHPLKFRYINSFEVGSITATGQCLSSSVGIKKCIEKMAEIDGIEL